MPWLTKSRYTSGLQCPKRLWMEVHEPLATAPADSVAFANGRAFDVLVQKLEPGVVVSRERGMPAAIAETTRLMRGGPPAVLYQPAFRAGDLAIIADVLRTSAGHATLVEVKSSTTVKPEHLPDVGFQTLVLRTAGIPVDRVVLAHVDNTFVLRRPGDYDGLVAEQDVTAAVEVALPAIAESAGALQQVMAGATRPVVAMGSQCTSPYDCPFIERCTRERGGAVEFPVDLLPRGGKTVIALRTAGYEDLTLVPAGKLSSDVHLKIHHATLTGEVFFDEAATSDLRAYGYPVAHLDFETMGLAVPEILGTRPYEQLPFQFSVHVEESAMAVRHAELLQVDDFGDFEIMARALLAALPDAGPVCAYNASFEARVLRGLAERVPARGAALRDIEGRLVDLLPIARAAYYHRDMKGSWSIKDVLPTIAAELDYGNLADVREGDGAQLAFMQIREGQASKLRKAELTMALLEYCKRDTYALVVLRRFLCGIRE